MRHEPRHKRLRRYYFHRLFPKHHDSFKVAFSIFLGVFIGVLPTLGIALILTVGVASLFKVPKIPGVVASFIAIPPTLFLFFYPTGYALGLWITKPPPVQFQFLEEIRRLSFSNFSSVIKHLWIDAREHLIAFSIGIAIVAFITASIAAIISYFIVEYRQKRHRQKREALLAKVLRES